MDECALPEVGVKSMVGTFCLVQMYGCGGKWWPFMLPSLCALFPALFRLLSLALSLVLAAACDPNVTPPPHDPTGASDSKWVSG
jgi:hypothetical protein